LKLEHDKLLSKFALNCKVRQYSAARSEVRHLRTIISELEPKLRDALKDAQMASRRERTAVSHLASAKEAMAKSHGQVVQELTRRITQADERATNAADEVRQLHDELHKSERAESKTRLELHDIKTAFPELKTSYELYVALKHEHAVLLDQVERSKVGRCRLNPGLRS